MHGVAVGADRRRSAGRLHRFAIAAHPADTTWRPAGEQAERCLENLRAICEAAGTTLEHAARVTVYMTDLSAFAEVNEVYARFFPGEPPARVTIGVAALPRGAQVEIDAIVGG